MLSPPARVAVMNSPLHKRFAGRTLGIATMHGKERAIGPAMLAQLPVASVVAIRGLDTDQFGAFSGEVRRLADPLSTGTAKARHGIEQSGLDLVMASEGSIVPYPVAPLVPCDEEWLVLIDVRDGRVFHHRHRSLRAMHHGDRCETMEQVVAFAGRAGFPGHALIVKPREQWQADDPLEKGICTHGHLEQAATRMLKQFGALWIEHDLRAMHHPTRMDVIREAAERFAVELTRLCPRCGECWFRMAGSEGGLPCRDCGTPTAGVRRIRRDCWSCHHQSFEPRTDGRTSEDPQFCPNCNP